MRELLSMTFIIYLSITAVYIAIYIEYKKLTNSEVKKMYTYLVVTICENEKYYSYVIKHNNNNNLLKTLNIKNLLHVNAFNSMKQAKETCERWNAAYKFNNQYLFGETF